MRILIIAVSEQALASEKRESLATTFLLLPVGSRLLLESILAAKGKGGKGKRR